MFTLAFAGSYPFGANKKVTADKNLAGVTHMEAALCVLSAGD